LRYLLLVDQLVTVESDDAERRLQMNKPYWVLLIALIVAGAVLVAGCASPLSNNTSPTPSTATPQTSEQHDAFLAQFVSSLYGEFKNNTTVNLWDVKWRNNTTVNVVVRYNLTTSTSVTDNQTIIRFQTIDDATNYVQSLNKSGYVLTTNVTSLQARAHQLVAGQPTMHQEYTKIAIQNPTYRTSYRSIKSLRLKRSA
jgi:flagellar basal body-associated protein FliL